MFLKTNLYIESFKDKEKINYNMFMTAELSKTSPTYVFTRRILQRQIAVENLSSSNTY